MENQGNNQLVELVNLFHAYEQQNSEATIGDFCRHYLAMERTKEDEVLISAVTQKEVSLNGRLGRTLGLLSKYANFYWRKMVDLTGLDSVEDFGYLACTYQLGNPTKSELIHYNISEYPSGIEVIKRLVRKGWLHEAPDSTDRRSKRITITPEGLAVLQRCIPEADRVASVILPNLNEEEKEILLQLLTKLRRVHEERYPMLRQKSMTEIFDIVGSPL